MSRRCVRTGCGNPAYGVFCWHHRAGRTMNGFGGYSVRDLEVIVESHRRTLREAEQVQSSLKAAQTELDRRRREDPVAVPRWVLEIITAHARKRYQNIADHNRTANYRNALTTACGAVGRPILPRDIPGEHHGSSANDRKR